MFVRFLVRGAPVCGMNWERHDRAGRSGLSYRPDHAIIEDHERRVVRCVDHFPPPSGFVQAPQTNLKRSLTGLLALAMLQAFGINDRGEIGLGLTSNGEPHGFLSWRFLTAPFRSVRILKLKGNWRDLVKKSLSKKKPAEGWPK
jgi:hypothetical protein